MLSGVTSLTAMEALMVALSGLAMVFLVLGCLALLIVINAKVVDAIQGSKTPTAAPAPKAAPAAAAAPAAPVQDEEELVAVLMAAIAAETESDPGSFRITNIQAR